MSIENNLIPPSPQINVESLSPFTKFCVSIGMIPSSYKESLTYEEQLLWLCNYLENTVIPAINNNGEAVTELQNLYVQLKNYVDDYFTNLDVQPEIDKKLDEMAEDGTFYNLINNSIFFNINQNIEDLSEQLSNTNTNLSSTNSLTQQNSNRITEIENEIPSIIGGNPKGTFADLTALETAYPDGSTGIFITADDGHWYYYVTGTGWVDGGVYQSSGIANSSITPAMLNTFLKSSIENTHIYPTMNVIKKLEFVNSSKSYFITFENCNILMLVPAGNNYTNIKVIGQTNFEIPNYNALVINKTNLWTSPLNYTPELVDVREVTLNDLMNNYIILLYNNVGNLQGCLAYNFPLDDKKLSDKKFQIQNKVLQIYNKQNNGQWIGTNLAHITQQQTNTDTINFQGSAIGNYNEQTNTMSQVYQKLLIYTGEWTAVFKEDNAEDFVGSGHGHEVLSSLDLFVDGIKYDFDTNMSLKDFQNIKVLAKSNVYSLIDNEILCEKNLLIEFTDKIKIKTKIIWKKQTSIYFNYINMLPVSRNQYGNIENPLVTNAGFNDIDYTIKNYNDDTFTPTLYENVKHFELFNNTTGYQFRTSIDVENDTVIEGNYGYVNNGSATNKIYFNYSPEHYQVQPNEIHGSTSIINQYYSGLVEN